MSFAKVDTFAPLADPAESSIALGWWFQANRRAHQLVAGYVTVVLVAAALIYRAETLPAPMLFLILPILFLPAIVPARHWIACLLVLFAAMMSLIFLRAPTPHASAIGFSVLTLVMLCHGFFLRHVSTAARHTSQALRERASFDALTRVLNRETFEIIACQEVLRSSRYDDPLMLLLVDVDDLKSINDDAGHAAGDAALRVVGHVLDSNVRACDIVGRLGGDEFGVLLPNGQPENAEIIKTRITAALAAADANGRRVGASIGWARRTGADYTDLFEAADRSLYEAKRARKVALLSPSD